jgi:hypothetical protein
MKSRLPRRVPRLEIRLRVEGSGTLVEELRRGDDAARIAPTG